MLSSIWGPSPAVELPEPGVVGLWSPNALRHALHTGDVTALSTSLPATRAVSSLPCYGGSCSALHGGAVSFAVTLMMIHPDKPDACLLALRLVDRILTQLPRGALSAGIRPALEAAQIIADHHDKLLDAESRKWIGADLAKADDAVADVVLPLLVFMADTLGSMESSTALHADVDFPMPDFTVALAFARRIIDKGVLDGATMARDLHRLVAAATSALASPMAKSDKATGKNVCAFVCVVLNVIAVTHRRIRSSDVTASLDLIRACVLLDRSGAHFAGMAPVRVAAATALKELWRNQAVHATAGQAAELVEAFACAERGADVDGMASVLHLLQFIHASTSIPPASALESSVCRWFAESCESRFVSEVRVFRAATETSLRWTELARNRTLPTDHADMLAAVTRSSNRGLFISAIGAWSLGMSSDFDTGKHTGVVADVLRLVTEICEPVIGADRVARCAWCDDAYRPSLASLVEVAASHAARAALFHAPACLRLLVGHAVHGTHCLGQPGHVAWRHITAYCGHLVRGVVLCKGEPHIGALATATRALTQLTTHDAADASGIVLRSTTIVGTCIELMSAVEEHQNSRHFADVEEAFTEVLQHVKAAGGICRSSLLEALAALPVTHLRTLQRCFRRHRGWIVDGAIVANLSELYADTTVLATLKSRRDVATRVGYTAARRRAVTHALLSLRERWQRQNESFPTSVSRRVIDFSGDAALLESAVSNGHAFLQCSL